MSLNSFNALKISTVNYFEMIEMKNDQWLCKNKYIEYKFPSVVVFY